MRQLRSPAAAMIAAAVSFFAFGVATAARLERVNQTGISAPMDSNGDSSAVAVSSDGRFSLFYSDAGNLVAGDSNGLGDLFLHDQQTGAVERVNVGNAGAQATAATDLQADVSDDGRYVVFQSRAAGLVAQDTYGQPQIYLRDRVAATTTLLSADPGGVAAASGAFEPHISGDGRYVLMRSSSQLGADMVHGWNDIYRLDRQSGQMTIVTRTVANEPSSGNSFNAQISDNGRFVVFSTGALNLLPGGSGVGIVMRDLDSGAYTAVSVTPSGGDTGYRLLPQGNAISADGRYVLFETDAALDVQDGNLRSDAFRFDRQDGSIVRVSLSAAGATLSEGATARALSADGNLLLMQTRSANVLGSPQPFGNDRGYVRNLSSGEVRSVGPRNGPEQYYDMALDCHLAGTAPVAVCSSLNDRLADADDNEFMDVFRRDLVLAQSSRISRSLAGPEFALANGHSGAYGAAVSADGRFVAFESKASNLVVGDNNGVRDVFLRDRLLGTTQRISSGADATPCESNEPDITPDGRYVVFRSCAALAAPAAGMMAQIYRYDRISGEMLLVSRSAAGGAPNSASFTPRLSDDGNVVVFHSHATNLVAGGPARDALYVRDIAAATTAWANRPAQGRAQPMFDWDVSGDGRQVLFSDSSGDFVSGDDNEVIDTFSYDRQSGQIERLSLGPAGEQLEAGSVFCGVSRDASVVAFLSGSSQTPCERPGIVLRNRNTGASVCADLAWQQYELFGSGYSCGLSANGDRLAFTSTYYADGAYHEELFLWRRQDQSVEKLTVAPDDRLEWPRMCADGSCVVFSSRATNLLPDDGNRAFRDVYIVADLDDVLFADGFEPQP